MRGRAEAVIDAKAPEPPPSAVSVLLPLTSQVAEVLKQQREAGAA